MAKKISALSELLINDEKKLKKLNDFTDEELVEMVETLDEDHFLKADLVAELKKRMGYAA